MVGEGRLSFGEESGEGFQVEIQYRRMQTCACWFWAEDSKMFQNVPMTLN